VKTAVNFVHQNTNCNGVYGVTVPLLCDSDLSDSTCKVIFNMAVMCFRRRKYTKDEDMRIWKYVRDRRENGVRLAGNSFWKQMENERVK
jgi:hypothetical protein